MQLKRFRSRMLGLARAGAAAAMLLGCVCGRAAAAPALWVASDDDSQVYMLGTVHMIDPAIDWMDERISQAFFSSSELWLELDPRTDKTAGFTYIARMGTSPETTLLSRLTPEERNALKKGAEAIGLSVNSMQGMRPWLASMMLGIAAVRKAGMTEAGVDQTLMEEAEAVGIEIRAFETGAEQIAIFASLDEAEEMKMLRATIDSLDDAVPTMRKLGQAWADGDLDTLVALSDKDMKPAGDVFYDRLLTERNARFADRIAEIMKGSGTVFVAVGTAHFANGDTVQDFLRKKGIDSRRLQ